MVLFSSERRVDIHDIVMIDHCLAEYHLSSDLRTETVESKAATRSIFVRSTARAHIIPGLFVKAHIDNTA